MQLGCVSHGDEWIFYLHLRNFLFLYISLSLSLTLHIYIYMLRYICLYTIAHQKDINSKTGTENCYTQKTLPTLLRKTTIFKQYLVIDLNISIMLLYTIILQLPWELDCLCSNHPFPPMEFCPFIAELSPGKDCPSTIHVKSIWELTAVQGGGKKQ